MKIILNPKEGATIKDIWFEKVFYLDSKEHDLFEPGSIMKFDDPLAEYLLTTFGFLQEIQPGEVDNYMKQIGEKKFKCAVEGCEFGSDTHIAFIGHQRVHKKAKDSVIKEMDIPVVAGKPIAGKANNDPELDMQKSIDSDADRAGLTGAGLQREYL